MTLTLITAPATEPLTLSEAKAHCRVEHALDDTLITALITAARLAAEHELQRPLITQTWQAAYEAFPSEIWGINAIALGKFRPIAITSITYLDQDGVDAVLAPSAYVLDSATVPGWVHPAYNTSWPSAREFANSVRIRFTAGYGAAADVPQCIKQWMLLMIGSMYAFREATTDRAQARLPYINSLLDPERVYQ